jgi:hypothetical protein
MERFLESKQGSIHLKTAVNEQHLQAYLNLINALLGYLSEEEAQI